MGFHKVKIVTDGVIGQVFVDGQMIPGVRALTASLTAGNVPKVTLELLADMEFEFSDAEVEKSEVKDYAETIRKTLRGFTRNPSD